MHSHFYGGTVKVTTLYKSEIQIHREIDINTTMQILFGTAPSNSRPCAIPLFCHMMQIKIQI